jgi:hypothetical protein
VHLEADLQEAIKWADANGRRWAFSLSNAGARYAEFCRRSDELDQLNWPAIEARDFRAESIQESKQAEFLLHERFPLHLVTRIGVRSAEVQAKAVAAIAAVEPRPPVEVRPEWYY